MASGLSGGGTTASALVIGSAGHEERRWQRELAGTGAALRAGGLGCTVDVAMGGRKLADWVFDLGRGHGFGVLELQVHGLKKTRW
ncbi:hypothetical protein M0R45_008562 [Rubus argutus]|uniref:Uncharacterized protein n=1 Tax=Rubus argutus TaxID=59490 RepID=A0AAW1Y226_RUBAR